MLLRIGGHGRTLSILLLAWVAACADGTAPDEPQEQLASLRVQVPDSVVYGEQFALVVTAVGSQGSDPMTGYAGVVALEFDAGGITPAQVTLAAGQASVQAVVLAGETGTLTASAGSVIGTASLQAQYPARLSGDAGSPANEVIPRLAYVPRSEDYDETHPEAAGMPISFRVATLTLATGTTVAEANTLLASVGARIVGGVPGDDAAAPGLLVIRLRTSSHAEMGAALAALEADPRVEGAAADVTLGTGEVPRDNGGTPAFWFWDPTPYGDNWGLERIRVPQMWNLNESISKRGAYADVAVVDAAVSQGHADLSVIRMDAAPVTLDHGTHVTGIIAATYDNGVGVDGVSPFARVRAWDLAGSLAGALTGPFIDAIAAPGVRVLNISLGYNWYLFTPPVNQSISSFAQNAASVQGRQLANLVANQRAVGDVPLIVVAAGNDSNVAGWGRQPAMYASPMAYASIVLGVAEILTVEAVRDDAAFAGGVALADFSDSGGQVSAPGVDIMSTVLGNGYGLESGTSMATPHVSGLAAYLVSLDPSLSTVQLRDAITTTAVVAGAGAAPRIDAFAAALDIDRIVGSDDVLRALLDLDDGTLDGNLRLDPETLAPYLDTDADGDGGRGDGSVDMADFRTFRDHILLVEEPPTLDLDGAPDHPKHDLNGNEVVTDGPDELFPVSDLNGDGILDRTLSAWVGGTLGAQLTDLDVLRSTFDDPDYSEAQLPGLIESGDVHIRADAVLAHPAADRVSSVAYLTGQATPFEERDHDGDGYEILTLPVGDYRVETFALDQAGDTLCITRNSASLLLGTDEYLDPVSCTSMELDVTFPALVTQGQATPLTVTVGFRDGNGVLTYEAGVAIDLVPSGGTVVPSSGFTDAQGQLTAQATLVAPATLLTVFVTAVDPASGDTLTTTVSATCDGCGTSILVRGEHSLIAEANASEGALSDWPDPVVVQSQDGSFSDAVQNQASAGAASAQSSATLDASVTLGPGGTLQAFSATVAGTSSGSASSESASVARGIALAAIVFEVTGGEVSFTLTGELGGVANLPGPEQILLVELNPTNFAPLRTVVDATNQEGSVSESGTLTPGLYRFTLRAYAGFDIGFGGPTSADDNPTGSVLLQLN